MLQNLLIPDKIVDELIDIQAKLAPLEARKEELKEALRGFGQRNYSNPQGLITVAAPSIPKKTGERMAISPTLFERLSEPSKSECFKTGFVFMEDVFSRAAKARVEITLL